MKKYNRLRWNKKAVAKSFILCTFVLPMLVMLFGVVPSLPAQGFDEDTPVEILWQGDGQYQVAQGGSSFHTAETTGAFTIEIPACSNGDPEIVKAYLHWLQRVRYDAAPDDIDWTEEINLSFNGVPFTANAGGNYHAARTRSGSLNNEYAHLASDVTIEFSDNFISGINDVTVTNFPLAGITGGSDIVNQQYGLGLIVIYECLDFDFAHVTYMVGADFFLYFAEEHQYDPTGTAFSHDICVEFPASSVEREISFLGLHGGQSNDLTPFRGHRFFYESGTGTRPETDRTVTDPAPLGFSMHWADTSQLVSSLGVRWDAVSETATVAANDTWFCVQGESVETPGSDPGVSGLVVAPVFLLPYANPTAVSLIDLQSSNLPALPWAATLVALVFMTGLLLVVRRREEVSG